MNFIDTFTKALGLVTAVIAVISGTLGVCTYFKDARRRKLTATLEDYRRLQDEVFCRLNDWNDPAMVRAAVETADNLGYSELNNALARIEHFCVGLNRGVYDFETFYQMAHGYFDYKLQSLLMPLLEKKLNKYSGAEDYYNNLHKVWARMKKRSGKPL